MFAKFKIDLFKQIYTYILNLLNCHWNLNNLSTIKPLLFFLDELNEKCKMEYVFLFISIIFCYLRLFVSFTIFILKSHPNPHFRFLQGVGWEINDIGQAVERRIAHKSSYILWEVLTSKYKKREESKSTIPLLTFSMPSVSCR